MDRKQIEEAFRAVAWGLEQLPKGDSQRSNPGG
jgi:hypothetical protein